MLCSEKTEKIKSLILVLLLHRNFFEKISKKHLTNRATYDIINTVAKQHRILKTTGIGQLS
jgi:hypothetical protein